MKIVRFADTTTSRPPQVVINLAIAGARRGSTCQKSQRGVAIYRPYEDNHVLSYAGNGPPPGFTCDGKCGADCNKVAVHAEERAILQCDDACFADLVHIKVVDGVPVASGSPSCWQCSRMILEAAIAGVWLLHYDGWKRYTASEFHRLTLINCGLRCVQNADA